jgi:hypothetical protein
VANRKQNLVFMVLSTILKIVLQGGSIASGHLELSVANYLL